MYFKLLIYVFQGRPDLVSGVRIDVMTEKTNQKSNEGTPSWLVAQLLSLVGNLNLFCSLLS